MTRRHAGILAAALAAAAAAPAAWPQQAPAREPGPPITFGPRLVDYPMDCVEPRGCRIECFQNGVTVAARTQIGSQDEMRLVVAATTGDEIAQRWIEIRPFSGAGVQTLLLTRDTFCDLRSIVVAPKRRP